jgi:hypothetical protein
LKINHLATLRRWSSQSQLTLTDDESGTGSSGYPTPVYGGSRPASETNSYLQVSHLFHFKGVVKPNTLQLLANPGLSYSLLTERKKNENRIT